MRPASATNAEQKQPVEAGHSCDHEQIHAVCEELGASVSEWLCQGGTIPRRACCLYCMHVHQPIVDVARFCQHARHGANAGVGFGIGCPQRQRSVFREDALSFFHTTTCHTNQSHHHLRMTCVSQSKHCQRIPVCRAAQPAFHSSQRVNGGLLVLVGSATRQLACSMRCWNVNRTTARAMQYIFLYGPAPTCMSLTTWSPRLSACTFAASASVSQFPWFGFLHVRVRCRVVSTNTVGCAYVRTYVRACAHRFVLQ